MAGRPAANNLVVIKAGRGVGAGIVLNGELFYGDSHSAGEIGHVRMVPDGERCRCGNTGCLETLVSTRTLRRRAREIAAIEPESQSQPAGRLTRARSTARSYCGPTRPATLPSRH